MLRTHGDSFRFRLPKLVSLAAVLACLHVSSPAFAQPTTVFVDGDAASTRVHAIASELRARGFVVELAPGEAHPFRVHVSNAGSAEVVTDDRREVFDAQDDDGTVARKIAESVRARLLANTPEPAAPAEPTALPERSASPPQPPSVAATTPNRNAQQWFRRGSVMLSMDEAVPLVSAGASARLKNDSTLRLGRPEGISDPHTPFRPLFVDVAVADHVTVGGTIGIHQQLSHLGGPLTEATADGIGIVDARIRAGLGVSLGSRLALWPRLGVSYTVNTKSPDATDYTARWDLTADVRLLWKLRNSWALTIGPSIEFPLDATVARRPAPAPLLQPSVSVFPQPVSVPFDSLARIGVAIGLSTRLNGNDDVSEADDPPTPPHLFFSVERALPLFRWRTESAHDVTSVDVGTADTMGRFQDMPRVAIDVPIGAGTAGLSGTIGHETLSTNPTFFPAARSATIFVAAFAPRVGGIIRFSRRAWVWPKVGLSYVSTTIHQSALPDVDSKSLNLELDAPLLFSPSDGLGLTLGPAFGLPIHSTQESSTSLNASDRYISVNGGLTVWL